MYILFFNLDIFDFDSFIVFYDSTCIYLIILFSLHSINQMTKRDDFKMETSEGEKNSSEKSRDRIRKTKINLRKLG